MNKSFFVLVPLLLLAGGLEKVTAQKVGTSSLQFLKVMPTARATAMGDAFVTLASGCGRGVLESRRPCIGAVTPAFDHADPLAL